MKKILLILLLLPSVLFAQTPSYVQVPPDSTGKKLATNALTWASTTAQFQLFTLYTAAGAEAGTTSNPFVIGAYSTSIPPFPGEGTVSALSMDSNGNLRTIIANSDFGVIGSQSVILQQNSSQNLKVEIYSGVTAVDPRQVKNSSSTTIDPLDITTFQARINTLGQKTSANSTPVVLASDQSTITVTDSSIKAEDAGHTTGDNGVPALAVRKDTSTQTTSADADYSAISVDAYGAVFNRQDHPNRITCSVTGIAATLTQMTGCAASAGLSYYITSMQFQSTTATSGTFAVQSGTGTNCGTTTTALFPNSGTANRFNSPPTTAGMANVNFMVPIKATVSHAICVIGVATNTISLQLEGFLAP